MINLKPFQINYIWVEVVHLLFLIDVCPSVCPSERTEHSLPHRVTSDFFNLVDWTCPRVLVQSTWNLFRSTVYELKLCTSYFWSMSIRPSVRQDGRNIAPDSILVIYMIFVNVLSWTYLRVLFGSIWNLHVCNIYGLKLCPTPWGGVAPSVFLWEGSELSPPQHFNDLSDIFSKFSFMNSSKQKVKVTSKSHQGHVKVMSRPRWGSDMK